MRVSFLGYPEVGRIPMQLDIGFGDAVTPPGSRDGVPDDLGWTASCPPRLYPREIVVEEKFEAMVKLGIAIPA